MIYLIRKETWKLEGIFNNILASKKWLSEQKYTENDFFITEDIEMKYVHI